MPGANMDPPRPHSPPRVPPLNPEEFGAALNTIEELLKQMTDTQRTRTMDTIMVSMIVHVPVASPYTKLYFHSALPWISSTAPAVFSPGQLRPPLPLPSRMLRPTLSNAKDRHAEDPGDA